MGAWKDLTMLWQVTSPHLIPYVEFQVDWKKWKENEKQNVGEGLSILLISMYDFKGRKKTNW